MKLESELTLICSNKEIEYEMYAFIAITAGKTLDTCFYQTIIKINPNQWLIKGPI